MKINIKEIINNMKYRNVYLVLAIVMVSVFTLSIFAGTLFAVITIFA